MNIVPKREIFLRLRREFQYYRLENKEIMTKVIFLDIDGVLNSNFWNAVTREK